MSRYIDAEQLEKDGWTMQRTYKLSATEMVCETKKPTDIPSIDVADAGKIIDELNKVPLYSREDERQPVRIVKSFFATDNQSSVNENRSLCKLRHKNGNCLCVGGFCTAVNDEICNAVRSAYDKGLAERLLKIQDILDYLDTELHPIISPEYWNVYSELHDMISTLPITDVEEVRHGRWVKCDKHIVKCNVCGNFLDLKGVNAGRGDANYCPNCGSRMDLECENG